jgi:hypothetical protein
MPDIDILTTINALSDEEERLYEHAGDGHGLTADELDRIAEIKVQLDRCYDLLQQRAGRRAAGLDPNEAAARPASVVETYEQ